MLKEKGKERERKGEIERACSKCDKVEGVEEGFQLTVGNGQEKSNRNC